MESLYIVALRECYDYAWRSINVRPSWAASIANCTECINKHRQFVCLRLRRR